MGSKMLINLDYLLCKAIIKDKNEIVCRNGTEETSYLSTENDKLGELLIEKPCLYAPYMLFSL